MQSLRSSASVLFQAGLRKAIVKPDATSPLYESLQAWLVHKHEYQRGRWEYLGHEAFGSQVQAEEFAKSFVNSALIGT